MMAGPVPARPSSTPMMPASPSIPSGAARVVRVTASPEALAAMRARLAARGVPVDFISWSSVGKGIVGAASDTSLAALSAEGLHFERLFDTIAGYQAARDAGDSLAGS